MGELLSPVEAILQNILGADNILVPPGSQVEEILQAIYYNTEYEKNPESRVAEILLAIKNKGVYDGPVLSRVEDILVHKLNNIPYTKHKKEDLSRVEQLLLDWLEQGGGEEIIEYTGTFPMTILANGEPLLDYLISGNTVQSSTPTPDSPVMPQGTGERTRNLWSIAPNANIGYNQDVDSDVSETPGLLHASASDNGMILTADSSWAGTAWKIKASVGMTYYISFASMSLNLRATIYTADGNNKVKRKIANYSTNFPDNKKLTILSDEQYIVINISVNTIGTVEVTKPMITTNIIPYEPYGYKIPISSANTTTPVYLGEVETTRKIKKLVLTGEEYWTLQSINSYGIANLWTKLPAKFRNKNFGLSTHLTLQTTMIADTKTEGFYLTSTDVMYIRINATRVSTVTDFKSYLQQQYAAGTPVTVWYVLATEETGIVNEPLMRIGDYSDTLSYAQAGVDVQTNKKPTETVIDVSTSVKPSEGYIKYTEPTDGPTPKTQVLGTKNHEIYMTSNNEVYILRR